MRGAKAPLRFTDTEPMGAGSEAGLDLSGEAWIRSRALGALFLAGAAIGALSMAFPLPDEANAAALWSNIALAGGAGVAVLALGSRLPGWFFHVALALGAFLVMRAVLISGDENSFYSVWFLWIGLYAFYFFK